MYFDEDSERPIDFIRLIRCKKAIRRVYHELKPNAYVENIHSFKNLSTYIKSNLNTNDEHNYTQLHKI